MTNQNNNELKTLKREAFSIKFKIGWGIGSFGTTLISGVYAAMLTIFYQDFLGLKSVFITTASIIYAIWNAINDPLFGFISDSTKSKKGRRIPYMRYTAPFLALTFILVWFCPITAEDPIVFWWMLITMLLYDTCYTIIGLVYSALLPEISESDAIRGDLQRFSAIFSLFGIILGFLLPDMFKPSESLVNFYVAMILVGITGALCVILTTFIVHERMEFSHLDEPLGLKESIKYTFKSKSFLILTSANFMSIFTQAIVTGAMFYVSIYILQTSVIMPLALVFLGLLIGALFANVFAEKIGVVQTQQILLVLSGVMLCLFVVVPDQFLYVLMFFGGLGLSGPLVLTNVLFAEVADEDELHSGVRREAAFFGVNALITKPAQSIALAVVPYLLEMANFITQEENGGVPFLNQPPEAIMAIKISIGLLPGIALLIGALILQFFPLKGAYLKEIQEKIIELHSEKKKKYEQMQSNNREQSANVAKDIKR
ncbi:MAG: MFS transporter [Promethearchaeota archaeon]